MRPTLRTLEPLLLCLLPFGLAGAEISGTVVGQDGKPMQKAAIILRDPPGRQAALAYAESNGAPGS